MIGFSIQIMDKEAETPLSFTDNDKVVEGIITDAVIMQAGTTSGKTSVTFQVVLPDGTKVLTQTTAALLAGLQSAIKGVEERWSG